MQIDLRMLLALGATALLQTPAAFAQSGPTQVLACAAVENDLARLACYDDRNPPRKPSQPAVSATPSASQEGSASASRKVQDKAAPAAAAAAPSAASAVDPAPSEANFGLDESALRKKQIEEGKTPSHKDKMVAHVVSVSEKLQGGLLLKLDNDQTWTETEHRADLMIKPGESVTITQGMFGGFMLSAQSGLSTRVRRLR